MHPKEGFVAIYLGEFGGSCEDMSYLLEGWGFVILMDDCLVQVLGVKAYPQLAICLFGSFGSEPMQSCCLSCVIVIGVGICVQPSQ